jgi:hypothetical protein
MVVSTNSTATTATTAINSDLHTQGIWTKQRYEDTDPGPAMLPTGSFKSWNVDKDRAFGDRLFRCETGVRNFVVETGFLTKLIPATHPWWEPQLTEEMCRRGGPLEHVKTGEWSTYLEERDLPYKIPEREWKQYKQTREPSGLKHRKKDILIQRALDPQEPDVLAHFACDWGLYRLIRKLYFYPEPGDAADKALQVVDNCTRRGITLEQHRELNEYFKDRGVIATLHHLSQYNDGEILHRFLLPSLHEPKIRVPRKPRASRKGRR